MRAVCTLGYHSEECQKIRDVLDGKFVKAKTSILNIYSPCYEQNITTSNSKRFRQNGRYTDIDEGFCDDSLGGMQWFNEPLIQ